LPLVLDSYQQRSVPEFDIAEDSTRDELITAVHASLRCCVIAMRHHGAEESKSVLSAVFRQACKACNASTTGPFPRRIHWVGTPVSVERSAHHALLDSKRTLSRLSNRIACPNLKGRKQTTRLQSGV